MAENVYIEGFGTNGGIPDFATEATLNGLLKETAKHDPQFRQMVRLLSMMARGEKISQGELKAITQQLRAQKKLDEKQIKVQEETLDTAKKTSRDESRRSKEDQDLEKKQILSLGNIVDALKVQAGLQRTAQLDDQKRDEDLQKLMREGHSKESAQLTNLLGKFGMGASLLADALAGAAALVTGINAYVKQQATDRFNLAQEVRQSGLFAGLDSTETGLTQFADTVRRNNFLLGEAADFTQRFAHSVGVLGVKESLNFVNKLAYAGDEGSDMMRRYGMEFGEVRDIAGTYLDTLRNINILDRMNADQLRMGMNDFMDTVVTASNVMKINMQDAAEAIKETLGRTDIASLLATMSPGQAAQVQEVVGLAGGMDNAFGEAIAMRLAAGSQSDFQLTDAFQSMLADPITMQLLPLIEQLAVATETGGVQGFQAALAASQQEMKAFVSGVENSSRSLLLVGEQSAQESVQAIARLSQTVDDADKQFGQLTEEDTAVVKAIDAQRQFGLALENANNAFLKSQDLADNMNKITTATATFAEGVEKAGVVLASRFGEKVGNTAADVQTAALNTLSTISEKVAEVVANDESLVEAINEIASIRETVNQTIGKLTKESLTSGVREAQEELAEATRSGIKSRIQQAEDNLREEIRLLNRNSPELAQEAASQNNMTLIKDVEEALQVSDAEKRARAEELAIVRSGGGIGEILKLVDGVASKLDYTDDGEEIYVPLSAQERDDKIRALNPLSIERAMETVEDLILRDQAREFNARALFDNDDGIQGFKFGERLLQVKDANNEQAYMKTAFGIDGTEFSDFLSALARDDARRTGLGALFQSDVQRDALEQIGLGNLEVEFGDGFENQFSELVTAMMENEDRTGFGKEQATALLDLLNAMKNEQTNENEIGEISRLIGTMDQLIKALN